VQFRKYKLKTLHFDPVNNMQIKMQGCDLISTKHSPAPIFFHW